MSTARNTSEPFELHGGDAGVRRLVDRLYDLIDTSPETRNVRALHADPRRAVFDALSYLTLDKQILRAGAGGGFDPGRASAYISQAMALYRPQGLSPTG